jgi:hypothetical protein
VGQASFPSLAIRYFYPRPFGRHKGFVPLTEHFSSLYVLRLLASIDILLRIFFFSPLIIIDPDHQTRTCNIKKCSPLRRPTLLSQSCLLYLATDPTLLLTAATSPRAAWNPFKQT